MRREVCPNCRFTGYKKNGHTHSGKQNYRCKNGGQQFVAESHFKIIPNEIK